VGNVVAQRVWLHIGLPKTGTSYLQDIVWGNREALRQQGLLLPGTRQQHFGASNHVRGKRRKSINPAATEAAFHRLTELVREESGDVLITHELFTRATTEQARFAIESFGGAETRVIITARDLARQVPAAWQQQVRQGSTRRLEAFLHDLLHGKGARAEAFWQFQDLPAVAARWGADLPADHVHVVTVPADRAEPSALWRRYASVLGIDPDSVTAGEAGKNESIGFVQAELLRRINERREPQTERAGDQLLFNKVLGKHVLTRAPTRQPISIDEQTHAWLRDKAREMVAVLEQRGYATTGSLDELIPQEPPEPGVTAEVGDDELLDSAMDAIIALVHNQRRLSGGVDDDEPGGESPRDDSGHPHQPA
jgi:hypothetical protein